MRKPKVKYEDLEEISYQQALDYQRELQKEIIRIKRKTDKIPNNALLLCEHNPVYTLGKSGDIGNLVFNEQTLKRQNIEFHKTNRGGDITYHGPGQITGYPIFDMDQFYNDVHRFVRELEQVVMRTLSNFDIPSMRIEGFTGVWLPRSKNHPEERKICAIGIHMSRWVSMHGFALNVNTNLDHFRGIIPCGIQENGKAVTSMQQELGNEIQISEVKEMLVQEFKIVFGFQLISEDIE